VPAYLPPLGVGTYGDKTDHACPGLGGFISLFDEVPDDISVGGIHPAYALPFLFKGIVLFREVTLALVIVLAGTYVQSESEFLIELLEQVQRGCPIVCKAAH
jgi:hypothetical protein